MVSLVSERLGLTGFLTRLAADAPRRETERGLYTDVLPTLHALGLSIIRLPQEDGSRLPLSDFFTVVHDLAVADSNLAHSLRNHYGVIENNILDPTPSTPHILRLAAEGAWFGGAFQEKTGSITGDESKFEPQEDGSYLLTTRRYYATGSIYATHLSVAITVDDETQRTALVPVDREGVSIPDDWGGFGQRLTGSGSIIYDHVRITEDDFIVRPRLDRADGDKQRYPFTFNQIYMTTVVAGIGTRALHDAIELVRNRSRNYYHGTTEQVRDEPLIQATIGLASAKAYAARAIVSSAVRELERSWDDPGNFDLSLAATLSASRSKITVEELALDVIESLTKVASASTLSTERALDRHWRNVKVLASHNPTLYKHQWLGAYELNGTTPPLGVYF